MEEIFGNGRKNLMKSLKHFRERFIQSFWRFYSKFCKILREFWEISKKDRTTLEDFWEDIFGDFEEILENLKIVDKF